MVSLAEALVVERDARKQGLEEASKRREAGRAVLQAFLQLLTADPVPTWLFVLSEDEIVVLRIKKGTTARERVGSWIIDPEMKLVFGPHATEWITSESCSRVLDEAVQITAQMIVHAETQDHAVPELRIARP